MEKAEAAKNLAEINFKAGNIAVAKNYALKAQFFNRKLKGINETLMAYHIHLAAARTDNGEPDYYAILGVSDMADSTTIKKVYKRVAAMVHPDKNWSAAAEGAFKHATEAKDLLLDVEKRRKYDLRRRGGFPEKEEEEIAKGKFWTICQWCAQLHVYERESVLVNSTAMCSRCHRNFLMVDGSSFVTTACRFFGWSITPCSGVNASS